MRIEHTRNGPAERLATELESFAADRDSHGKHERATAARTAAERLRGGDAVAFERVAYTPSGYADRSSVFTGTRGEVIASLDAAGLAWLHAGKEELARAAAAAIADVEAGEGTVRVGWLTWRVESPSV